jgi:hypothetical protein
VNDRQDIFWAPRVNLHDVKKLYLSCARGLYDEELVDDVGIALFLRCDSIMEYTWANEGMVRCKRCHRNGAESYIERRSKLPRELLRCSACGWQIQWRVYLSETEKRSSGQLMAGHARRAFEDFHKMYPLCRDPRSKLLAIDRLIHEFHWMLKEDGEQPVAMRTACANLLEGTATEIMDLLNGLTYSENTDAELLKTRNRWMSHID